MKRVIASLFGTVAGLVMLLSFKTHSPTTGTVAAVTTTSGNNGNGTTTGGAGTTSSTTSSSSGTGSAKTGSGSATSGTYTGDVINTQWGPVQVRINLTNGKITSASAIQYPSGNSRDQQINAYALPKLNSEAISASSAKIDMISGATFTSTGYIQSLQSALNKAGL